MLSNILQLSSEMLLPVRTPSVLLLSVWPLSLSLATTREISVDFSSSGYLDVSVPQVPLINLCIQLMIYDSSSYVFPHSEIHGSRLICSSPWLIAACHVFLRLLMPRHSPYALVCLNSFWLCVPTQVLSVLSSRIAESLKKQLRLLGLFHFSPFPQLLVRLKLFFLPFNLKLYLERPFWFQNFVFFPVN